MADERLAARAPLRTRDRSTEPWEPSRRREAEAALPPRASPAHARPGHPERPRAAALGWDGRMRCGRRIPPSSARERRRHGGPSRADGRTDGRTDSRRMVAQTGRTGVCCMWLGVRTSVHSPTRPPTSPAGARIICVYILPAEPADAERRVLPKGAGGREGGRCGNVLCLPHAQHSIPATHAHARAGARRRAAGMCLRMCGFGSAVP